MVGTTICAGTAEVSRCHPVPDHVIAQDSRLGVGLAGTVHGVMREKRELAVEALNLALERSRYAQKAGSAEEAFAPLAEALWWVCVLNDSYYETDAEYEEVRDTDPRGKPLEGLRFARNVLTHEVDITGMHGLITGADFPANWPVNLGGWVWRRVGDLDLSRKNALDKGREVYERELEGHKVEPTLRTAADFLVEYTQLRARS